MEFIVVKSKLILLQGDITKQNRAAGSKLLDGTFQAGGLLQGN